MKVFSEFELDRKILGAVKGMGWTKPTLIQEQTIPPALEGRDVMGLAATGTGKTAAFVLPILQRLLGGHRGRTRALVISPTRELADQTHRFFEDLGRKTKMRSLAVYGGTKYKPQIKALSDGVDVVVATPGRLLDYMGRGNIDLSRLEVLVIDETDQMFDMGFLPDVRKILRQLPKDRQTLMFSATMPGNIQRMAEEILKDPVTIEIAHSRPVDTVAHSLFPVNPLYKTELVLELLGRTTTESVLIFVRTKARAEMLGREIRIAGLEANILQGDMPQSKRKQALDGFRQGKVRLLVATDIAARGLDISNVSHVINYDMPPTVDDYTHRIGRTGRAAKTGEAFTLVAHEDLTMVRQIEEVLGEAVDIRLLEDFPYPPPPWYRLGRGNTPKRRPRRPVRRRP